MVSRKIRRLIKSSHPNIVRKVKKTLRFKYLKLLILIGIIILAYYLFSQPKIAEQIASLKGFSYFGYFIAGIFLIFGFTAPFALGFFIISHPDNIFLASLLGASGSIISNLIIFRLIQFSFMEEFNELKDTKTAKKIEKFVRHNISLKIRHYLLYIFAGILIATPLPDEIGISMLAGMTTIKIKILGIMSFILHYIEILVILILSS